MSPSVLIIGAGGLGCPAAFALAAGGCARIAVVDDDVVDETNLHRQVLHTTAAVGEPKVASLARALTRRFPHVAVVAHRARFDAATAAALSAEHDVLVDASDNFATKFLANDAAVLHGKVLVHGAAIGLFGQALTVPARAGAGGAGPCYRCLFEDLPPGVGDSCATAGVLGPVPGVIGALQAAEALRVMAGAAPSLIGRLIQYDSRSMSVRTVEFRANPACKVCGEHPQITALRAAAYASEECPS